MSDIELSSDKVVLEAFAAGATQGVSEHLHIEKQVVYAQGWWVTAIRLDDNAFLVRADSYSPTTDQVTAEFEALLRSAGLTAIERDPALADMVTLQAASLIGASWEVWAAERDQAHEAFRPWAEGKQVAVYGGRSEEPEELSVSLQLELARRVAEERPPSDLPPSRIVLLDVEPTLSEALKGEMMDCEVIPQSTQTTACVDIGYLAPAIVVVDVERAGQETIPALRSACGRFLPIVALSGEGAGEVPGADAVITRPFTTGALAATLRNYLPEELGP